ncbi:hypothetical protein LJC36_00080 [Desulfovibrio sp. OttesenSCG-928-C14]|nr:hypothetical protein [Desulfovibrio sp. OttesenSCG-928-C14]
MTGPQAEYLSQLKLRLESAGQGERGAIVADCAAFLGCSVATVYRRLEKLGFRTGRKTRSDCGSICVDEDLARLAGGMLRATTRANGKKTLPLTTITGILESNRIRPEGMPHPATLARGMRAHGCHPRQLGRGSPAQSLRSLHPNHTWEMDASVCILFYLPRGRVAVVDERKVYKNKPHNQAIVDKARVIRWSVTDHASGAIFCRYTNDGEKAADALNVLIEAMAPPDPGGADADQMRGAPFNLYTDKGSPFIAGISLAFFERLGIHHIDHKAGNPRATGQVENSQNIIETQFEGRLRFLEIASLEELNAHLDEWRVTWNARAIHSRHKMTRNQAWRLIRPEELRLPQSAEVLRGLVASPVKEKTVRGNLILEYTPPGFVRQSYSLAHIPGVIIGNKIGVSVNPYEAPNIDVIVTSGGEEHTYTLTPIQRDRFGFDVESPVIGQEMRGMKDTAVDRAIKAMDKAAYGAATLEEAEKARKKGKRVYADIDVMADVREQKAPLYFPIAGTDLDTSAPRRDLAPLSPLEAAMRLKGALAGKGRAWRPDYMAMLQSRYPDGVPYDAIEDLEREIIALADVTAAAEQAPGHTPDYTQDQAPQKEGKTGPLRLVVGG